MLKQENITCSTRLVVALARNHKSGGQKQKDKMKKIKYSEEYILKRRKWNEDCWKFIKKAEYLKATRHAKLGLKHFPDDTIASFNYYSVMADYALSKKTKAFKEMHKEAVLGMKKLFKKTSGRGISKIFKMIMKNEYYYQTKQFKKQFYLGVHSYKRSGDKYDMYSAGVGAANYALELANKHNKRMAFLWAKKAIESWEIYFEINKNYYNAYVHYALAFGILGEEKKMMKALKTSAKLCKKDLSYREFTETIEAVKAIPLFH